MFFIINMYEFMHSCLSFLHTESPSPSVEQSISAHLILQITLINVITTCQTVDTTMFPAQQWNQCVWVLPLTMAASAAWQSVNNHTTMIIYICAFPAVDIYSGGKNLYLKWCGCWYKACRSTSPPVDHAPSLQASATLLLTFTQGGNYFEHLMLP